ncbi:MAG: PKD domain-containing protein, partial [Nanoarchaeota archaeon]|nr:PKD domain-containing protein [Nanoarchaeota archaeon]
SLLNGIYTLRIITNVTDEMCANTILSQRDASLNVFTNTLLEPPVAIAGPDRNVCAGNSVVFDGSSSYDPDGTIISYIWNFGDGNILSGSILNHIYTNPGNYTATLLITDNDGLQSQDNLVVTVNNCTANQNPVANAGPDVTTNVSQNILFNGNNSYDPDGTIISYIWNFGDGNLSSGEIVNHAYLNAGIYNVTLIVTDNNGAQSTDNAIVTVNLVNNTNITLQLTIDADPLNGTAPLKVEFSSDVSGNSPFTYYWDFDDGSHSTQSDPTHIFNKSGTYNVELEVTDNLGNTITKGIIIKVSKNTTTTEDQYNIHSLSIAHVSLDNQIFYPGDIISLNVELLNNGDYTESNIILNVLLTELGLTKSSSTITLSQGSNKYQLIDIQIPEDTKSGLYNLRIKLSNGYTSDIEYKTITILNNDTSEVLLDESNETSVDWLSVVELVFLSLFIILLVVGILLLAREIKRISQR